MTAFSQGSNTCGAITADVTIRSYNSRHLDIVFYGPESCHVLEEDAKKIIAKTHDRGRIEVKLFVRDETADLEQFEVDQVKAASYYNALKQIKETLDLSSDISIETILTARNVIVPSKKEQDSQNLWAAIKPAMESASDGLDMMRRKEGKNLCTDLASRIDEIEKNLEQVETDAATLPLMYKQRLMEKIAFLTSDTEELDPVRISQEAAILADKSDVSEEIVRLHSHIKQFRECLDSDEAAGRKLNFLIQEFNREFNTIGSKAGKASLSHSIVDLKSQLEKIREQVQNIE